MLAALALLALTLSPQEAEPTPSSKSGVCAPAASLREALQKRFGSSRIMAPSDLYEDERGLFAVDHRGACPGMTSGRFFGAKERPAMALVLMSATADARPRLVVARPALSTWTFLELAEMDPGSTTVVWTEGPGSYKGSEGAETRQSAHDVVILSAYESWKRAYLWNGRTFEPFPLSP